MAGCALPFELIVQRQLKKRAPVEKPVDFVTTHRASFQEIDQYGHLNTMYYVSYFLTHRFTALRERFELGLQAIHALDIGLYTKHMELSFLRPVVGDRAFSISSSVTSRTEETCRIECKMFDEQARTLATCALDLTCVDKKSGKCVPWPEGFLERFYE